MEEVIRLTSSADMASIRRLLEEAPQGRVVLVAPQGCEALKDPINLALLRRWGLDLAKEVVLVSPSGTLRQLASQVGVPAFSSLRWVSRGPSRVKPTPLGLEPRLQRLLEGRDGRTIGAIGEPYPRDMSRRGWWRELGAGVGFSLSLAVLFLAFVLLIVPQAKVVLTPARQDLEASFHMRAEVDLDRVYRAGNRIPARVLELPLTASGQVSTLAERDVPDSFAHGVVTLLNRRSEAVTVPMGTIVSTSGGTTVRFRTLREALLPAGVGSRAEVDIIALTPGPGGNVPPNSINRVEGPLALQVAVQNVNPTSGGTVKKASYVTAEDKKRLEASLLARLRQEGGNELQGRLGESEILPLESVEIRPLTRSYDKGVGEEAELLSLTMRVQARGMAIDTNRVKELATWHLAKGMRDGFELREETVTCQAGNPLVVDDKAMEFNVTASAEAMARIDPAKVKGMIAGLPVEMARERLGQRLALAEEPQVELSPNWLGRIPWLLLRTQVSLRLE